jgi:hypothetical protein
VEEKEAEPGAIGFVDIDGNSKKGKGPGASLTPFDKFSLTSVYIRMHP